MNCRKHERWISDDIDGRLASSKRAALHSHLEGCPSCRTYWAELVRLQDRSPALLDDVRNPGYWDDFSRRLGRRLATRSDRSLGHGTGGFARRWAWAGVAVVFLIVVGIRVIDRNSGLPVQPGLTQEQSLAAFLGEAESDPGLIEAFSAYLEEAVREEAGLGTANSPPRIRDDPFFWEGVSDEELVSLEQELRTQYGFMEVSHEVY